MQISDEDQIVLAGQRHAAADFSGRHLMQFSTEGSRFERCRFDNAVIEFASFGAGHSVSEYVGCTFDGAKLHMGPGGYARFAECSFAGASIENWFCHTVELVDCVFTGRLRKVVFNGTVPPEDRGNVGRAVNQFEGNDFSRAELIDVAFRTGIDLAKQRLPSGAEYTYLKDAESAVRRARIAFNTWKDPDARKHARGLLAVMEEDVVAGQRRLLIRVNDYPPRCRPAIEALLDAAQSA